MMTTLMKSAEKRRNELEGIGRTEKERVEEKGEERRRASCEEQYQRRGRHCPVLV